MPLALPCFKTASTEEERIVEVKGARVEYKSVPDASHYATNEVVTSKYTWYNFIFLNLFEQFSNMANVYFLLIGILQMIPQVSPSGGIPTMYYPLVFIVVVSGIRAIVEDVARHNADRKRNSYPYDVLTTDSDGKTTWKQTESGKLKVGSLIRLKKNEMIPSDMLLLGTSNSKGHCFIDKANLNGETKLEVYTSIRETRYAVPILPEGAVQQDIIDALAAPPPQELIDLKLELEYELPNSRFDSFRGIMWLNSSSSRPSKMVQNSTNTSGVGLTKPVDATSGVESTVELTNSPRGDPNDVESPRPDGTEIRCSGHDLLMRETNLKNTDYIVGLIVYTGNDTKIQRSNLDGEKPKLKVSKVMRLVNLYLIWMFIFQVLLCIVGGILAGIWYKDNGDGWYLDFEDFTQGESIIVGIYAFFTWMINLSYLVPISLVVSGEMVKFIMSFFINADIYLYHPVIKKPTHCNSSTIHEDLGLVNYICSDKTGTLTTNSMQFRFAMCSDTREYGSKLTDIAKAVKLREQELIERQAGTWKPKPVSRWSDMVEKFHPPRKPNHETKYDIECCNANCCLRGRRCPNWCRYFFWSKKHFVIPGQKDHFASDDVNEEDIFSAVNPNLAGDNSNCFNKQEKKYLLDKLYRSKDENERLALERYMLHMTLSNTVKPYYEGPKEAPILKFQPESAEELAMVQFAQKCGFTKLPEKEENEKSPEEKRLGANTFISIQPINPVTLKNEGEAQMRTYAFLAVFGFTSARARVTLIYQDVQTGRILCMTKGQDTTVMPFITLKETPEESLMSTLKECCDNGLRTLVAGHAEKTYEWWKPWGDKYIALKNQTMDEKARAKAEHDLYEAIEKDVGFDFLGCIGLEDQLQPLVPETIQACLRANIKVWMITGDKLETARNIGLACNLIDADMQPQIKAGDTVQHAMSALEEARLIEITGEWNSLFQNKAELNALFDIIDFNHDGLISVAEIAILMETLHTGVTEEKLITLIRSMINDQVHRPQADFNAPNVPASVPEDTTLSYTSPRSSSKKKKPSRRQQEGLALYDDEASDSDSGDDDGKTPIDQSKLFSSPSHLSQTMVNLNKLTLDTQDPRTITVDKESFVAILQKFERSPYEAILYDVNEGLERYHRIHDHIAYPLSMLVSRDAFLVMFPEQGGVIHDPRWPKPTQEQLENLRRSFFFLANVSKSLIFARAQPSMKKKMVTEIQFRYPEAITLAIGDGANDTDMITAAHIGIGIAGVEGTAATNSADYAIGTFRMVHSLLFVHGFWSYQRIASMVNFIFYKAALLAFTQFLFGIHSGFSGQQFFNDFLLQIYNIIMTSLPIIVLAVMDKQLPRQTAENNVVAYKEQQYQSFNFYVFSLWIARSILHSALLYFVPYLCFLNDNPFPNYNNTSNPDNSSGTIDLWFFSTTVYYATAILPTLNILFITKSIQIINLFVILLSLIAAFLFPWLFSLNFLFWLNPDMTGSVNLMYSAPTWWLILIITVFIPLLAELTWQVILVQYFPSLTQILQEQLYVTRQQEKELNKLGVVKIVATGSKEMPLDIAPTVKDTTSGSASELGDLEIQTAKPKLTMKRKMTIIQPDGTVLTTNDGSRLQLEPMGSPNPDVTQKTSAGQGQGEKDHLVASDRTTSYGSTEPPLTSPRRKLPPQQATVRLERPVLQPEDEHVWLEVKSDNLFMRSGLQEPSNKESLVESVIAYNKTTLASPNGDGSVSPSPFEPVSGPKKLLQTFKRGSAVPNPNQTLSPQQQHTHHNNPEEQMRSGFVRALLRFRNQTGSIFDSAAQTSYHTTVAAASPDFNQLAAAAQYDQEKSIIKPPFDDDNDPDSIDDMGVEVSFEESVCRSVKD